MIQKHRYMNEAGEGDAAGGATSTPGAALPEGSLSQGTLSSARPINDWRENFTEEVRDDPTLDKFDDVQALAEGYINLEKTIGSSIRIPTEEAGPEARKEFLDKLQKNVPELMVRPSEDNMDEFYQSIGRPKDAESYELPDLGEGTAPGEAEAFKGIAFQAGLTNKQYQRVVKDIAAGRKALHEQQMDSFNQDNKQLRDEWGNAYDNKYRAAYRIAERTGAPEHLLEGFRNGFIDTNTLRYFDGLADKFGVEGAEIRGQNGGDSNMITPNEADAQISEILNNKEHPYWDSHHPDHQKALDRMVELQKQKHPGANDNIDSLRAGGWSGRG